MTLGRVRRDELDGVLALRGGRLATTIFDLAVQALFFDGEDEHTRMTDFLERRRR